MLKRSSGKPFAEWLGYQDEQRITKTDETEIDLRQPPTAPTQNDYRDETIRETGCRHTTGGDAAIKQPRIEDFDNHQPREGNPDDDSDRLLTEMLGGLGRP
jgi:hypothetical protein